MATTTQGQVLLVGISGPSSSGKTTLSRLLRDIIPHSFILHEDDFYKPDADIPIRPQDGIANWDCLGALDLPALSAALAHIKAHGAPPPNLVSKEDQNSVGTVDLAPDVVSTLKRTWQARSTTTTTMPKVAIIDGFLLFGHEMPSIRAQFDARLFLRADYATVKRRREARQGYVTLEGFWEDPPGYVDKVVWPNYVSDHAYLFVDGDVVGGKVDETVRRAVSIEVMPDEAQGDMTRCLEWAFQTIVDAVNRRTLEPN